MAVSYTANAVYAKAHALYGKRLKRQNYEEMLSCRSRQELVNYLKTRTAYSTAFENVPSDISSAQIEELLKLRLIEDLEAIGRYEISAGENFYEYFIVQNDIKQILTFIRLLIKDTPDKYLNSLPPFFNKHTKLDLYAVASARDYDRFLEALSGSPYKNLLSPFKEIYKDKGVYIRIESVLNDYLKKYLFGISSKASVGKNSELSEMIKCKFDLDSVVSLYRLLKLKNADDDFIKNCISKSFTNFSKKEIEMLVNADEAHDILILLNKTCYKKDIRGHEQDYFEIAVQKVLYERIKKAMRYSSDPDSVMLSYMLLAENEIKNIIHIVEGIRYNIPEKNTAAVLVGAM